MKRQKLIVHKSLLVVKERELPAMDINVTQDGAYCSITIPNISMKEIGIICHKNMLITSADLPLFFGKDVIGVDLENVHAYFEENNSAITILIPLEYWNVHNVAKRIPKAQIHFTNEEILQHIMQRISAVSFLEFVIKLSS